MNSLDSSSPPRVWVLLGKKAGGNGQLISLADALGWPYDAKQMVYNKANRCPNLLLGASLLSLKQSKSSPLRPPWPDLVIGASRRSVPVARWIKKQSGGQTKLVHLHHTQVPWELFDLIITTPQYCLPNRRMILHNIAPLNRIASERLAAAARQWHSRLADLPRPYHALLVGGNSSTYTFDPTTAAELGRQVSAAVRTSGGSLLVSTSPRTPVDAAETLLAAIDCPAFCYRWRPNDPDNPYLAYLALADRFIVTVDSASQAIEACLMDKPVEVFEWPAQSAPQFQLKDRMKRWLERTQKLSNGQPTTQMQKGLSWLYDQLVYLGLLKPSRDFAAYYQVLQSCGLVTRFGQVAEAVPRRPLDDMERTVSRIRQLFASGF